MDAITILLFKPGFTIMPLKEPQAQQSLFGKYPITIVGIDETLVWKSGISVVESVNHSTKTYDGNRISLLFLLVSLLSQPLFHTADEYLIILNPFATYLTCRRSKNVKNLFVSLLNTVISYDSAGYVS